MRQPLDVFVSHDWPQWITRHGDAAGLFRKKPYFRAEVGAVANPRARAAPPLCARLAPPGGGPFRGSPRPAAGASPRPNTQSVGPPPLRSTQAERGELGSPPNLELLNALQPSYWFAAHLHCKFAAVVPHGAGGEGGLLGPGGGGPGGGGGGGW